AENYPTEMRYKFEIGRRLFSLDRFDEAIPVLQEARRDPKFKADATIDLAKSFLAASFVDEASETLEALINEYQLKGDARSKEMYYWRGRALEQKRIIDQAVKLYSQVAQWDFNYRDVQARIKRLRSEGGGAGSAAAG
ncbi:MAG: tetratricopeptide repeat protein, partial [Tepidisphaeraceae bacterium]